MYAYRQKYMFVLIYIYAKWHKLICKNTSAYTCAIHVDIDIDIDIDVDVGS